MPSSGRPIGAVPPGSAFGRTRWRVAKVVVSVGPYTCRTAVPGWAAASRWRTPGAAASPPAATRRSRPSAPGSVSAITLNRAVVRNAAVTPWRAARSRSTPGWRGPSGATTARPPLRRGAQISKVEASKTYAECSRTASAAPSRHLRSAARAVMSAWVTPTPLGRPVEPEVNMTYASRVPGPGPGRGPGAAGAPCRTLPEASTVTSAAPGAIRRTQGWSRVVSSTMRVRREATSVTRSSRSAGQSGSRGT